MSEGSARPSDRLTFTTARPEPMTLFEHRPAAHLARLNDHLDRSNKGPHFASVAHYGVVADAGTTLPPIHLPPSTMPRSRPANPSSTKPPRTISVASLLSDGPEPSRGSSRPPSSSRADNTILIDSWRQPAYPSHPSVEDVSPRNISRAQPIHGNVSSHYLDQPPLLHRAPAQPSTYPRYRRPTSRRVSSESDPDLPQHSPTGRASYTPSYSGDSIAPSPCETSLSMQLPAAPKTIPPPFNYSLTVRQQPCAARACGYGERDRRVVDPPPILELRITDPATGASRQDPNAMLALHCTLLKDQNYEDATEIHGPSQPDVQYSRRLMGTLVASPYQAKDENGVAGTFFVFSDLSCRNPGQFRLKFKLLRIDPQNMTQGAVHASVGSVTSDVFSVYTAKDFPGMRASSALLKALCRQGLNVGVKKGSEARKSKGKTKKEASSDDDGDDDDNSEGDNYDAVEYSRSTAANSIIGVTRPGSPWARSAKRTKTRKVGKGRKLDS